jgi:O-antigen/teichoic acid export membrane protein
VTTAATYDARELDRSLVRGVAWTGAAKTIAQVFSWVTSIFVARLLTPADYGIIGMAMVYVGVMSMVTEFGLGSAVVAHRSLTNHQIAQLNGLSLVLGVAAVGVSMLAAQPMGWFFHSPGVAPVIVALSAMVLFDSARTVPAAVLAKGMRFKFLAMLEAIKTVLIAAVTVALAFAGFRYWSLVVGVLVGSFVATIFMLVRHRVPIRIPKPADLKEAFGHTRHFLVTNVSWYAYSNADFAVAGRMLGQAPLGEYTFAWTLANSPAEKAMGIVNRVLPSVYSAASSDAASLRRYLLRITEVAALVMFPAAAGLALVSPDLIRALLGDKWLGAVAPLCILAIYAAIHSLSVLVPPLLLAVGEVRVLSRIVTVSALVLPVAFVLGGWQFGSIGIASVWITVYPAILAVMYRIAFRAIDLHWRDYASALGPAVIGTGTMAVAVVLFQQLSPTDHAAVRLVFAIVLGVLVYGACLQIFFRPRLQSARAWLLMLRGKAA